MAADIPHCEPSSFAAGSTVRWTKALPEYSAADSYVLKYAFRGASKLDVTAETDENGTGFVITLKPSDSTKLDAGEYRWQSWVEKADDVFIVAQGFVTVEPNFQKAEAGELESTTEKEIALCDKVIEALLGTDIQTYTIDGRTFEKKELDKVMVARGILIAKLGRQRGQALPSYAMAFRAIR